MKKSKFLKPFSFASLALLMGIAGTMAFAPLGASPSVANANELETTTEQGLITPKADDPVIYTTESGLEIKWGNAAPSTFNQSLSSGNLKGFPYFTTTSESTTYTWVIIGRNSNVSVFNYSNIASHLFSSWKTNSTQTYQLGATNATYFFKNIYESTTPAGSAINGVVPSKSYVVDTSPLVDNAEIASGCVLVLANECVATGVRNTSYAYYESVYRFCAYRSDLNTDFKTAMQGYYTNKSLGLSSLIDASLIQSVTLKTYEYEWYNGSGWAWRTEPLSGQYIFPLAARANGSTFTWSTYLTANQMKLSVNQWVRGGGHGNNPNGADSVILNRNSHFPGEYVDTSGVNTKGYANDSFGYRPAFVLKIS